MKKSGRGRIINVSSLAHGLVFCFKPKDLNFKDTVYAGEAAYALSKLSNVLFTIELSKRLEDTGQNFNYFPFFLFLIYSAMQNWMQSIK